MLGHMEEVFYNKIPTKGFGVKIENELFTAVGSRCRRNLKFISRCC